MTIASSYPLLQHHAGDETFAWWRGEAVSARRFRRHVHQVADMLPEAGHAINLCEDRYLFLVGFTAMLLRGQVNLLPPSRAPAVVSAVAREHPGSYCLVDQPLPASALPQHLLQLDEACLPEPVAFPEISAAQRVATLFTSGSTGQAQPHSKCWGELYRGAQATTAALGVSDKRLSVVATVPPQHMFGLEMSVILPLVTAFSVDGRRPFFPADLQQVLSGYGERALLVTTPVHLRTCVEAGLAWPSLATVVSATAPLTAETASQAERLFACEVVEIYGSTETGAMAVRRTATSPTWQPHRGLLFQPLGERVQVSGGHLPRPVVLNDRLRLLPDGRFTLEGRCGDMVKIAGKRASLEDLNRQLQSIPGVEDGVLVLQPGEAEKDARLAALVVAPQLETGEILGALRERLDPAFLPRPIYRVERLPRNETGKLPLAAVMALLASMRKR